MSKCEFNQCKSGLDASIFVNETVGDGSWRTGICARCAAITRLKDGDDIPYDGGPINKALREAYGKKSSGAEPQDW